MEEAVLEYLKELLNQEKLISGVVIQSAKPKSNQQSDLKSKVLEKEIKDTQKLLDKYVLLLDREDFAASEIILDKIKSLEMTLNQKTNEQLNITNQENLTTYSSPKEDYLYSINEFLCNNDLEALKNIIDHSIDFITLSDLKTIKDINLKLHIAYVNATNNALPKE
ncbi:MAG: hypothetical protein K0Q99_2278 [Clostridia bacterium]|jgi:hypothetical protein|nr:hypothetical protein [Clostridia bacterium]